jgi:hypothetical protein
MECQRSMENERKDGVPFKHNPQKIVHMNVHEKKREII